MTPGFPLLWSLWHQFYPEYEVERSRDASHPLSQPGWDAATALPLACGRGTRGWWPAWPGAVLGHRLMLWAAYEPAVKPWPGLRWVEDPAAAPGWRAEGSARDAAVTSRPFLGHGPKLPGSLGVPGFRYGTGLLSLC